MEHGNCHFLVLGVLVDMPKMLKNTLKSCNNHMFQVFHIKVPLTRVVMQHIAI